MMDKMTPLGIIIAGGQSRRFQAGSGDTSRQIDKFLSPFGPSTLLGHIIHRAQQQISHVMLNVNGDPQRVSSYGLDIFSDTFDDVGPLGGVCTAMKLAGERGFSHIVTFSSDSPFFPENYVTRLMRVVSKDRVPIAISQSGIGQQTISDTECGQNDKGRLHPVMGVFAVSLYDDLKAYIERGERRVMWWVQQHSYAKVVWSEMEPDPFFNINSREDLEKAEKLLNYKELG